MKREPIDDDPEVVKEGQRHDHGPVVAETAGRVKHEGPMWAGSQSTACVGGPPSEHAATAAVTTKYILVFEIKNICIPNN